MRNPLDLNNFPDDFTSSRDHTGKQQQVHDDSSSSASAGGGIGGGLYRKKKNGGGEKQQQDESGKVYECRFCSLKFCKSQALGGHMNRHRQERETETLNRARQLVFSNDNILPQVLPQQQLGGQAVVHGGGFHHHHHHHQGGGGGGCNINMGAPTRLFSGGGTNSTAILPPGPLLQPPHQHMYTTQLQPRHVTNPYSSSAASQYPPPPPINDYFVGHVCSTSSNPPPFSLHTTAAPPPEMSSGGNNYTCIGAPVGQSSFTLGGVRDMASSSPLNNRYHHHHHQDHHGF